MDLCHVSFQACPGSCSTLTISVSTCSTRSDQSHAIKSPRVTHINSQQGHRMPPRPERPPAASGVYELPLCLSMCVEQHASGVTR